MRLHKTERVKVWFVRRGDIITNTVEIEESVDGHPIVIARNKKGKIQVIDIQGVIDVPDK